MPDPLSPRELLEKLVAFPTVSRDTNLPLVDWVEGYLGEHGITCHRDYDETGQKASLYAHVGPEVDGGVVLSGHTDVVPGRRTGLGHGPVHRRGEGRQAARARYLRHEGFRRAGHLGRGGGQAARREPANSALPQPGRGDRLQRRAADDRAHARQRVPKAALAIIGEPTEWGVVTGHKGGGAYDIHVHGHEVHSSLPHTGVSAIMEGARLIDWANRVNEENRARASRRQRLRSAVDDAACGHHPRRHGA
jgi:acetylornithine deacetylase